MIDSVGQAIATGTQDFAALAGLFCTDSVEKNVQATHLGYGNIAISSLSLLGVLSLVKSALKLVLGRERCRSAGFSLDSLRGLYGYAESETSTSGDIVKCYQVRVEVHVDCVDIQKSPLANRIVLNLGSVNQQNPILAAALIVLSPGATAWLLMIIKYKWTWVWICAIPGLHLYLLLLISVPLLQIWKNGRPKAHLRAAKWDTLMGKENGAKTMTLLQAKVRDGDVLHIIGDRNFLHSRLLKFVMLLTSAATIVAYICQYAILKDATNKASIIWVVGQAIAALVRVIFWAWNRDLQKKWDPKHAEYLLVLNYAREKVTFMEVICAAKEGSTTIPRWVLAYLCQTQPLQAILNEAASRSI